MVSVAMPHPLTPNGNYRTAFQQCISATTEHLLVQVQQPDFRLTDAVREQALHTLSYALKAAAVWPVARDLVLRLAPLMEQAGQRHDWMPYLTRTLENGRQQGEWQSCAEVQFQLGLLHRLVSDYGAAERWLQAAIADFRSGVDCRGEARALNELAWIAQLRGELPLATAHAEAALALLAEADPERGMSYRVLGMVAIQQKNWNHAELLHTKALIYFKDQQDPRRIAWGTQNLAYTYHIQGKSQEAILLYSQALALLEQLCDHYHWAIAQINFGDVCFHAGYLKQAIDHHRAAERVAYNMFDPLLLAKIHVNLGLAFLRSTKYLEAQENFLLAVQHYQKCGNREWQVNAMDGLAMAYLAQGYFNKAITVIEKATHLLPEIVNSSTYSYISEALIKHLHEAQNGLSCNMVS